MGRMRGLVKGRAIFLAPLDTSAETPHTLGMRSREAPIRKDRKTRLSDHEYERARLAAKIKGRTYGEWSRELQRRESDQIIEAEAEARLSSLAQADQQTAA